ncbi:MAG TPA: hypothetical protein VF411_01510, partial [Bacteroidia bacterium]
SGLSSTTTASVTATPSATTVYTVTVTSSSGCVGTKTSTVTVNTTPTLTVNSPTVAICSTHSTTLTVTGSGSTYSWTPSSGLSATTGTNVTATPTASTTYTITATLGSCTNTATSAVSVNATPTLTVNSNTVVICSGNSATLTVTGSGSTYSWTPSTGLSTTTGTNVIATPTVTTTYTITATLGSCINTSNTVVYTPTLSVNSGTIGIGGSIALNANGTYYPYCSTTFSWTPATGLSATTGSTVIASPRTTTIYTVTQTFCGKCIMVATSTVTVLPSESGDGGCFCVSSFAPYPGKKYLISAWTREDGASGTKTSFTFPAVYIDFNKSNSSFLSTVGALTPSGTIIDGWQRIEGTFTVPDSAYYMIIRLTSSSGYVLYDDIRVSPFDGSMKTYVYDPVLLRLTAELDERNYSTIYEYDEEGKLIRIKKETERGIMTINEIRNSQPKQN